MTVYATAEELRLMIGMNSSAKNPYLLTCLEAASEAIDAYCNRPDGFVALVAATTRTYPGTGREYQHIDECTQVTAVAVKDSPGDTTYVSWAATDWVAFRGSPKSPNFNHTPYHALMVAAGGDYALFTDGRYVIRGGSTLENEVTRVVPTVQITAKWGYATTCPSRIHTAAMAQASRWWKRFQSGGFADMSVNAELGDLAFKLQGKPLDPDIAMMLTRLIRPVAA